MTWIVIVAVGAGSFVLRLAPLLVFERVSLSGPADRAIRYAGIAAITALIAVSTKQAATGSATLPSVLAVAAAIVLAARGATMLRLLVVGAGIYAGSVIVVQLLAR